MTVSILNAVKLPVAEQVRLIQNMQKLAGEADDLVKRAVTAADTSGKRPRPNAFINEVRQQVSDAATMVQHIETRVTSLYGADVAARQAGSAAKSLQSIADELPQLPKDRFLSFGNTLKLGLDSTMQERIRTAGSQVGSLKAWTHQVGPVPLAPPMPVRPPSLAAAAAPATRPTTAPPVAFSSRPGVDTPVKLDGNASPLEFSALESTDTAVKLPASAQRPSLDFSSPESLDTPVRLAGDAKAGSLEFSSPESLDKAVKARKNAKRPQLRFTSPPTVDQAVKQAPGAPGNNVLLFLGRGR